MKNSEVISAVIGGAFFAVPYLALTMPIVPSLLIGAGGFIAGQLVLKKDTVKKLKETNLPLYRVLEKAKVNNNHILDMTVAIDDINVKKALNEINDSVTKIIKEVEKNPKKEKKIPNFFDYYLPITIKIIDRFDEIENQKLTSKEINKFNSSSLEMLNQINSLFKTFINNLYSSDLQSINVEMKVLNSMIKADGLDGGININKEDKNE